MPRTRKATKTLIKTEDVDEEEDNIICLSSSSDESSGENYVPEVTKKKKPRKLTKIKKESDSNVETKTIKKEKTLQKKTNNLKEKTPQTNKRKKQTINNSMDMDWTETQYISEMHNISYRLACNIIQLFDQENTIPFIARYRRNMTNGMEAEKLRAIKESYEQAKAIKQRASVILKSIDKLGKWTPSIHALVKSAKSLHSLGYINSLFKVASTRSLSERARQLGLGKISNKIVNGQSLPPISSMINPSKEGLKNEKQIKDGIIHILSDIISKDKLLFDKIQDLYKSTVVQIQVTQRKTPAKVAKEDVKVKKESKSKKVETEDKFENYYNFQSSSNTVKPHQILAINRGESSKFLSVKISVPESFENALRHEFKKIYSAALAASKSHNYLLMESFDYSFKKSIEPAFIRRVRHELNEQAERASIEVFAINLKQLLLSPPVRGKTILGIDPGFYHGCKLAVVSENGSVLATSVMYLKNVKGNYGNSKSAINILVDLVKRYNSSLIALGNGTACRETEELLSAAIKSGSFKPVDVSYTIVNESGASIYSCSEEAQKEFPNMDYNLISAISIARRLQDPLAELVKIEPKHLGVGMYQHDLPEKQLNATLNDVVIEAVSFVGVDVNTASVSLLKRIAGLNLSKAKEIIQWRTKNGSFTNRKQLLEVKGIGNKSFEQCSGFMRILPETTMSSKGCSMPINYLDQTWIHPESYDIATQIIEDAGVNVNNLGTDEFIDMINKYARWGNAKLAKRFKTEESTIDIIIKGLTAKKEYDIRSKGDKPLFRKSLTRLEDLEPGITLRGEVRNVTHFGAFVDVGVTRNGLIPLKFMKGQSLSVGQRVQVNIKSVEKEHGRICLELIEVL